MLGVHQVQQVALVNAFRTILLASSSRPQSKWLEWGQPVVSTYLNIRLQSSQIGFANRERSNWKLYRSMDSQKFPWHLEAQVNSYGKSTCSWQILFTWSIFHDFSVKSSEGPKKAPFIPRLGVSDKVSLYLAERCPASMAASGGKSPDLIHGPHFWINELTSGWEDPGSGIMSVNPGGCGTYVKFRCFIFLWWMTLIYIYIYILKIWFKKKNTRWKPRTRKLTRLFRPYLGRNTPRGSVGVTFLVRHAWNDSIGKSLLVRKSWSDTLCKTSLRRSCSNTLGKTLLVRDSWSHTLCKTLLECYSL